MEILNDLMTAARLDPLRLAESIESVLRDAKAGRADAPERIAMKLPGDGVLLVMPAGDQRLAMVKLVTVHSNNPARSLPTIQGEVLVMEAASGRRLGLLDGPEVTARRTAALSLLAAQKLAPDLDGPLLIIGAGVQARAHLEAFARLGVKQAFLASRTKANAESLAEHGRSALAMDCSVVDNPASVLPDCPLVVTATTSVNPVFSDADAEALHEKSFIAAVGAFRRHMAELPPGLVRRSKVYVCTMVGARTEAGDLVRANVDWSRVTALADALDEPRPETGPVVFKSVGHALFDLAAARLAFPD